MRQYRVLGFLIISLTYIIAAFVGILIFKACLNNNIYIRVLLADIAATLVVYAVGIFFKNASIYDPYWSIQPMFILISLVLFYGRFDAGIIMLLLAVCYWGIRLTANWASTFKNLSSQDWRYDHFKHKFPRIFPLISLFGIHMFPTLVVYLAVLPGVIFIENSTVNLLSVIGFVICLTAATLQLISDRQMQHFRRQRVNGNELIRIGLWKYSRHPNYLGEILMWWGVYIMMLSSAQEKWILGVGALINTLMFYFISIPMADRRNRGKPGYEQYLDETRSLLPFK